MDNQSIKQGYLVTEEPKVEDVLISKHITKAIAEISKVRGITIILPSTDDNLSNLMFLSANEELGQIVESLLDNEDPVVEGNTVESESILKLRGVRQSLEIGFARTLEEDSIKYSKLIFKGIDEAISLLDLVKVQ
ncbi:hypothetical protein P9X10_02930 [Bacillus cereus]|nr:hypothetical protein [Bacillus cereus]